jgi:hypothetical protein
MEARVSPCGFHAGLWWTKWHWERFSPVIIIPPLLSIFIYHLEDEKAVGGHSQERQCHSIGTNRNKDFHVCKNTQNSVIL